MWYAGDPHLQCDLGETRLQLLQNRRGARCLQPTQPHHRSVECLAQPPGPSEGRGRRFGGGSGGLQVTQPRKALAVGHHVPLDILHMHSKRKGVGEREWSVQLDAGFQTRSWSSPARWPAGIPKTTAPSGSAEGTQIPALPAYLEALPLPVPPAAAVPPHKLLPSCMESSE